MTETANKGLVLNNNIYDILKKAVMFWLPGLATFYFALAQIWGLPYGEEVVGTIAAFATFLGIVLGISNIGYSPSIDYDGNLRVDESDPTRDTYSLEMDVPLEDIAKKDTLTLKVQNPKEPPVI